MKDKERVIRNEETNQPVESSDSDLQDIPKIHWVDDDWGEEDPDDDDDYWD